MKKQKRKNYTKVKFRKFRNYEKPDFMIKVSILTYDDLKKWDLIDSKTYKMYLRNKVRNDYEGGGFNG